jgi:L-iditol 2-dehydrogenase
MRAAVYRGPGDLRVEERPVPPIGPDEALLRVRGCGICGTDHRIVAGGHRHYPAGTVRVPGHEVVGEIVDAGAAVAGTLPDGLVFVAPNMGCGRCEFCLAGHNNLCRDFQAIGITEDGGFADFMRVPSRAIGQGNVIALAGGIDPAIATLIEPLACVIRGQEPLDIGPNDTVLVVGAGPIGLLHTALAKEKGARRIVVAGRGSDRLATAIAFGADRVIDVNQLDLVADLKIETGGRGCDVVIVAASAPDAAAQALELAAMRGRISWFAGLPKDASRITVDANLAHYKELRVTGTTACSTADCGKAAEFVNSGRLDLSPLVTHRLSLEAAPGVFAAGNNRSTLKMVLEPAAG